MEEKNHKQMIHNTTSRKAKIKFKLYLQTYRNFLKIYGMVIINSKLLFKLRQSIN